MRTQSFNKLKKQLLANLTPETLVTDMVHSAGLSWNGGINRHQKNEPGFTIWIWGSHAISIILNRESKNHLQGIHLKSPTYSELEDALHVAIRDNFNNIYIY